MGLGSCRFRQALCLCAWQTHRAQSDSIPIARLRHEEFGYHPSGEQRFGPRFPVSALIRDSLTGSTNGRQPTQGHLLRSPCRIPPRGLRDGESGAEEQPHRAERLGNHIPSPATWPTNLISASRQSIGTPPTVVSRLSSRATKYTQIIDQRGLWLRLVDLNRRRRGMGFSGRDHVGLFERPVSTTTKNLPDHGVASRVFERTQKVMPSVIAFS
jgi:hypothetical protein